MKHNTLMHLHPNCSLFFAAWYIQTTGLDRALPESRMKCARDN